MLDVLSLEIYNIAIGLLTTIGLLYLFYIDRRIVRHQSFLVITMVGVFVYMVISPIMDSLVPSMIHVVHTVAAGLIIFGLYDPVRNDLRKDDWADLLLDSPKQIRQQPEWMTQLDDEILDVLYDAKMVLTPVIIAQNVDYSRSEVNRRLSKLTEEDYVERVTRGKYRITTQGERYVRAENVA